MSEPALPPTTLRSIVMACLPTDDRVALAKELDDLYRQRRSAHGETHATRWYLRQTIGFVIRLGGHRLAELFGGSDSLRTDALLVMRSYRRRPAFPIAFIFTLAVATGVLSTVYAAARWVLLRPVPGVTRPDDLVTLRLGNKYGRRGASSWSVSQPDVVTMRERLGVNGAVAASTRIDVDIGPAGGGIPRRMAGEMVSANYFAILGTHLSAGRSFVSDEDSFNTGQAAIVISSTLASSLGLSPQSAVGTELRVNGAAVRVVGVAPSGFHGIELPGRAEVWLPLSAQATIDPSANPQAGRSRGVGVWGTMLVRTSGSTLGYPDLVQIRANAIMEAVRKEFRPNTYNAKIFRFQAFPGIGLDPSVRESVRRTLSFLGAAAALLLLLAIANLANLALIRATLNGPVTAIRYALGADRIRIARGVIVEALVLGVGGSAVALVVTVVWSRWYQATQLTERGGSLTGMHVDAKAAALSIAAATIASIFAFLQPALSSPFHYIEQWLRRTSGGTASGHRIRMTLVSIQVALTVVLLVAASLLGRTVANLRRVDLGFNPDRILTFALEPHIHGFEGERLSALMVAAEHRLATLRGVRGAAFVSPTPMGSRWTTSSIYAGDEGAGDPPRLIAAGYFVSPGFLTTIGARVIAGERNWQGDSGTVVLTRKALATLYPGMSPLDAIGRVPATNPRGHDPVRIVAVIEDIQLSDIKKAPPPGIFRPLAERYTGMSVTGLVATEGRPSTLELPVERAMAEIAPDLPVFDVRTARELVDLQFAEREAMARVASTLGIVGLLLAVSGLYGVLVNVVAARRREFGIRSALGADQMGILVNVVRGALIPVAIGAAIGLGGAAMVSKALASQLFALERFDPLSYAGAIGVLFLAAALAAFLPAYRASRVAPAEVLREE